MRWDIFCKVIDNHGDIGVCWRLATDLVSRGHTVRLWVDDPSALGWMAPGGTAGVEVLHWLPGTCAAPGDVIVEAFGCDPEPAFLSAVAESDRAPVWINLEYLTAEPYAQRCHGLPSPVRHGPMAGATKWFFYPGFGPDTGGLLRETDLPGRQAAFDREAARLAAGVTGAVAGAANAGLHPLLLQLFCYEPPALAELIEMLAHHNGQVILAVAAGRATAAARKIIDNKNSFPRTSCLDSLLSFSYLPLVSQSAFDERLWSADLNFVRGEDSLVRALWAGEAFVWQIYPQADDAHHAKLGAFLDWLDAPPSLCRFHRVWNGIEAGPLPAWDLPLWREVAQAARHRLLAQADLVTRLVRFVHEKQ